MTSTASGGLEAPALPAAPAVPLEETDLRAVQAELLARHGPQGWWWPGQERFEIAVGAVLVQRSRWVQAASAIDGLRSAGLLSAAALASADESTVRRLVRPAGFPSAKPRRVLALARWMHEHGDAVGSLDDAALRSALLGVEGVGQETADAIALYCFERPVLVCDEYARRLLTGRGHDVPASYAAFRRRIAPALARAHFDAAELAELHGLIVEEGKAAIGSARARPR